MGARVDACGGLVLLENQDRSQWDRTQIVEGMLLLRRALEMDRPGPYQIQAMIAALHAEAKRAEDTDWPRIVKLYEELLTVAPSPVVALNHAVAAAMAGAVERGLHIIDRLASDGVLDGYYLLHAARADLLRRRGRAAEAADAYRRGIALATNEVERRFLEGRLEECVHDSDQAPDA